MSEVALPVPHQRRRHWPWKKICLVALALWLCFVAFIGWAMRQPPETFGAVMKHMPMPVYFLFPFETMWSQARRGALQVGSIAPDFNLELFDKSGDVQLASFRGKQPVVLVFGSYT